MRKGYRLVRPISIVFVSFLALSAAAELVAEVKGSATTGVPLVSVSGGDLEWLNEYLTTDSPEASPQSPARKPKAAEESTSSPRVITNSINDMGAVGQSLMAMVPTATDKRALARYFEMVNPQAYDGDGGVGSANRGLKGYFAGYLKKNQCYRNRVVDFYSEVSGVVNSVKPDAYKPSLGSSLAEASKGKLKPGWLYQLALKHSGNDPALALNLIGMCGHDDYGDHFNFKVSTSRIGPLLTSEIERLQERKVSVEAELRKRSLPSWAREDYVARLATIRAQIEQARARTGTASVNVSCPSASSVFFYPESLGAGVDIPADLRRDVVRIQRPRDLDASSIPAKHYHVLAGAMMACQLVREGMSPLLAEQVERQSARIYRGVRLCQVINGYRRDAEKPRTKSGAEANLSASDLERIESGNTKIRDAGELYSRWYTGGKTIAGKQIPCLDLRIGGPMDLLAKSPGDPDYKGFNILAPDKPSGWSNARYDAAKARLATWMIDSRWTETQHAVGAKFAGRNCRKAPANQTLEDVACRVDEATARTRSAPTSR
jgi:hypothetical protein